MVLCRRSRTLGCCDGCFGFWPHSRSRERFTCWLRPQRPHQCKHSIGVKASHAPTSFELPEVKGMTWQRTETGLHSTPRDVPHWSPTPDALREKTVKEDCSKGVYDECLIQEIQGLCHSWAAKVKAQHEAEAAVQRSVKQAEQIAGQPKKDSVRDDLREEKFEAFKPKKGAAAKPPLGVALESQQRQEQQQERQQEQEKEQEQQQEHQEEHQAAEERQVLQAPAKPAQRGNRGGCQLELFTLKPKQTQRFQTRRKRTNHDMAIQEDERTVAQPDGAKAINRRGFSTAMERGAVKNGRAWRAAWQAAAAATAAAAEKAAAQQQKQQQRHQQKKQQNEWRELDQMAKPVARKRNTLTTAQPYSPLNRRVP
mmetsp:Transcript_62769/g.120835  ORF Transcript_62769/g.120835 Transcript_62769/m.120835 type:complete len:368 (+) Transcript_62769:90-1193(+)